MYKHCPECEKKNRNDLEKYGFNIIKDAYYWTMIPEEKKCCPVKVQIVNYNTTNVKVKVNNTEYTIKREQFMKSSWRDFDSY